MESVFSTLRLTHFRKARERPAYCFRGKENRRAVPPFNSQVRSIGGNHRKRDASTKDIACEEVEPLRKKQRSVWTMLSTSSSKREHDTSMGNTTINAKEEIKTA